MPASQPTEPQEIDALLARIALRDRSAFRTLYEQTAPKLLGICLRILGERAEAEDALQETFVKVWHKAESFDGGRARATTWLATIARNQAIDHLRARGTGGLPEPDGEAADPAGPERLAAAAHDHQRMQDCLEELEGMRRQVVRSTYLSGWTYQQAAEAFDVPLNTVKTWIRRSLAALRECVNR